MTRCILKSVRLATGGLLLFLLAAVPLHAHRGAGSIAHLQSLVSRAAIFVDHLKFFREA